MLAKTLRRIKAYGKTPMLMTKHETRRRTIESTRTWGQRHSLPERWILRWESRAADILERQVIVEVNAARAADSRRRVIQQDADAMRTHLRSAAHFSANHGTSVAAWATVRQTTSW